MKKSTITKTLVAGKLAIASTQVYSAGKCAVTLSEEGVPRDILTQPYPAIHPYPKDSGSKGSIYTEIASNKQIHFMVQGIPNDGRSWRIYVFYSQQLASKKGIAGLAFPRKEAKILTGITVKGGKLFNQNNQFGYSKLKGGGNGAGYDSDAYSAPVILPVGLTNLSKTNGLNSGSIYFQALAFPTGNTGNILWGDGCSSEVDKFRLDDLYHYNPEYNYVGKGGEQLRPGAPYRPFIHGN
ncbi:MAG: hypothetical protein KAH20_12400 [Methylococcales bacterium]|nr:hypothetical protein [Methylococcales bacterium]